HTGQKSRVLSRIRHARAGRNIPQANVAPPSKAPMSALCTPATSAWSRTHAPGASSTVEGTTTPGDTRSNHGMRVVSEVTWGAVGSAPEYRRGGSWELTW